MPDWNHALHLAESEQSGELACDACGKAAPLVRVVAYGIETMACAECRGEPQEPAPDLATTEAARGEAAWTKLCELADRAGDHWLAFDIKKAACEYGVAREKHAIETLAARWRESIGSAANG